MGIVENLLMRMMQQATVVHKVSLSAQAVHVRLQGEAIRKAVVAPGDFLRLWVGYGQQDLSLKEKVRSYSAWQIDPEAGIVDLAVATHSDGPGTDWVSRCQPGDTVYFGWHKSKFLDDDTADDYLFVGDLSALGHLYEINRGLSPGKTVQSVLYSQQRSDLFADVDGTTPFTFYEMPQNPVDLILEKLSEMVPRMQGRPVVYLAGDSRVCVALTNYFRREQNWSSDQIKTKPFWNPQKRGLE